MKEAKIQVTDADKAREIRCKTPGCELYLVTVYNNRQLSETVLKHNEYHNRC